MAYVDISTLKLYLGITSVEDDTLLDTMVSSAQAIVDSYCRQTFEATDDTTRYFDAIRDVDGRCLYLGKTPLCAITTVTNGDGSTISASYYVTEPRNETPYCALTLKSNAPVAWTYSGTPENAIAIEGKWAYSEVAPYDVAQATLRLAAYLYRQKDNQSNDLDRPINTGGGVVLLPSTIPADVKSLLAPYRRLFV